MQTEINFENAHSSTLDGLNPKQLEAVTHKHGPLLIIAGAGTGKTTVVTRRIAHLIESGLAKPSEILALTFTEKAAAEMEERVDQLLPYGCTNMWIGTFHAFADRLLKDYSLELGLPANFRILTGVEQAIFFRQHLFEFKLKHYRPLSNPTSHIEALITHFSRLKDELISPEQYLKFAKNLSRSSVDGTDEDKIQSEKTAELADTYQKYQELLIKSGNLDFGDLIYYAHQLLAKNKLILAECQQKFKYILVDEYQDTNLAQNEIIKLLASKDQNVTVVGDDDQSIYRFRGASISNILDFTDFYSKVHQVVLTENYRSSQEILDTAYDLIQHNNPDRLEVKNKIDKRLTSPIHGTKPSLIHSETLTAEADTVATLIVKTKAEHGYKNKDFSILIRANSQVEPFVQALNLIGLPYAYAGASNLFEQTEIKTLISFLRVLVYTDDNLSLYNLAISDLYSIEPNIMADLFTRSYRTKKSLYSLLGEYSTNKDAGDNSLLELENDLIKYQELSPSVNAGELLYAYLTEKGYLKKLSENLTLENEIRIKNIAKFFDRINQFNHACKDRGLVSFLLNLEMLTEYGEDSSAGEIDPNLDAVNILTAHGSKGLEWEVVFVVNMVADRFPSRRRREQIPIPEPLIKERLPEGDFHTEEERRLFYVACTRARRLLYFTAGEDYGGKRKKRLSPFVGEALPETITQKRPLLLSPLERIERFNSAEIVLAPLPKKFTRIPMKLSRLQIDDYDTCPKKFYFAHIIGIPLLENHALAYGSAIHSALGLYFTGRIRDKKITLSQIIDNFKQNIGSGGFVSLEHEKDRRSAGIATLTRFFHDAEKEKRVPGGVEVPFEFVNNKIIVNGRYDLIYRNSDQPEIYDFKTSNIQSDKKAKAELSSSKQMRIYALAWQKQYGMIPKTTLHFIEHNLTASTVFSADDLLTTETMITNIAEQIQKQHFIATPEHNRCQWCAFRDICPNRA